ncbi:MAG TPA: hypothetical protein VHF89_11480 [Solirubrobacteraceae bacterium]|nr:hypothetical protein [Solirubrobacteraceae bacterium]
MSKLRLAGTTVLMALAVAAVAVAQDAVTNTYDVDGSTTPRAKGSKRKPVPIGITFAFTVGEVQNRRPATIKRYSIRFGGTQVNTAVAPACSKATLDAGGPDTCPRGAVLGGGFVENVAGARDNPNDQSIPCNASVTLVNAGGRAANLYFAGSPNSSNPRTRCAIELAATIPARYVQRGSETALEFEVPDSLLHPLNTLSNAVKRASARVPRKTKRIRGRKRGYFEAIGGCTRGSRTITVVFTPEQGENATAQSKARC